MGQDGQAASNGLLMALELADGSAYEGYSFGAEKSVSGELVFQTGMFPCWSQFIVTLTEACGIRYGRLSGINNGSLLPWSDSRYYVSTGGKLWYEIPTS